jgi:phage repressor protein C with HTH and peptisase S24 domain
VSTPDTFSERLRTLREQLAESQDVFANRLGISRNYLSMLEKGRAPGDSLVKLFDMLEATHQRTTTPTNNHHFLGGMNPPPTTMRMVPTIFSQQAAEAVAYEELSRHWSGEIATSCTDKKAFGLVIAGDAMVPNFHPNDVCIVMPNEEARNDCLVAAKLNSDGVVLRRFTRMSDGRVRLLAYNALYPPLEYAQTAFDWLWPVHSMLRKEW